MGGGSTGSGSRPGIVDVHVHLTRDLAQERLVFPRPGYADHWRWANGERVNAHLEAEQIDGVVMLNYMDVHRMAEAGWCASRRSIWSGCGRSCELG